MFDKDVPFCHFLFNFVIDEKTENASRSLKDVDVKLVNGVNLCHLDYAADLVCSCDFT